VKHLAPLTLVALLPLLALGALACQKTPDTASPAPVDTTSTTAAQATTTGEPASLHALSAKRLDGAGGSVRLCGLSASVRQVFDIAGFTGMFSLFPNRHAALDQHPNRLDTPARLVDTAAQLLGANAGTTPASGDPERTEAAANLLGVPASAEALQKRSTVVGPAVAAKPAASAPPTPPDSRWKRLFGKD